MNDEVFERQFLDQRIKLRAICPIDALVLVLKFDIDRCDGFKQAAEQFIKLFGFPSLQSLVILCIQSSAESHYSDKQFDKMLRAQCYYKYLKENNDNSDIPYCLWNNISPYPNQNNNLLNCLEYCKQITSLDMDYIFNFIQNDLNKPKPLPPQPQPKNHSSCIIL
jgi:hypothetical protein